MLEVLQADGQRNFIYFFFFLPASGFGQFVSFLLFIYFEELVETR